ncbi:hypothetical protein [Streptomyces sp. NPDC091212]|uniref:hypothetical protein n=1 Tax=Streptomyces sp. NPDC091212 TaxID=3155191 RepID=UPI00341D3F77
MAYMEGLTIGMVVYDRTFDMPGQITSFAGGRVCLERPTGFAWVARLSAVRLATPWERRQLAAIGRLHCRQRHSTFPASRFGVCGNCHGNRLLRALRGGRIAIIACRFCRATGRSGGAGGGGGGGARP